MKTIAERRAERIERDVEVTKGLLREFKVKTADRLPPSELRAWMREQSEATGLDVERGLARLFGEYSAKYRPPQPSPIPSGSGMPQRDDYFGDQGEQEYQRDLEDWVAALYAPLIDREAVRERKMRDGRVSPRGAPAPVARPVTESEREVARFDAEVALIEQKANTGSLTASEALAWHRATGWTPSGQPLPDTSQYIGVTVLDAGRR